MPNGMYTVLNGGNKTCRSTLLTTLTDEISFFLPTMHVLRRGGTFFCKLTNFSLAKLRNLFNSLSSPQNSQRKNRLVKKKLTFNKNDKNLELT